MDALTFIVLLLFGGGLFLVAFGLLIALIWLKKRIQLNEYASGKIVGAKTDDNGRTHLTVEFMVGNETLVLTENRKVSPKLAAQIDRDVDVRYDPNNLEHFYVVQNKAHVRLILLLIVIGIVMFVASEFLALESFTVLPFFRTFLRVRWFIRYRILPSLGLGGE